MELTESSEILMVFLMVFVGLALLYFLQRWIEADRDKGDES